MKKAKPVLEDEGLEIKGTQFGIRLEPRGVNDPHICFRILCEDDEHWYPSEVSASSHWIDDLIKVLQSAKAVMKNEKKDPDGYGYEFK